MTTESESETLITQDMIDRKGVWGKSRTSLPVSESDIRKWAIAVYWPKTPPAIFWDADYAASTRWGGIIAAPVQPLRLAGHRQRARAASASEPTNTSIEQGPPGHERRAGRHDGCRCGPATSSLRCLRDWDERETRLGQTLCPATPNGVAQPGRRARQAPGRHRHPAIRNLARKKKGASSRACTTASGRAGFRGERRHGGEGRVVHDVFETRLESGQPEVMGKPQTRGERHCGEDQDRSPTDARSRPPAGRHGWPVRSSGGRAAASSCEAPTPNLSA